MSTNLISSGTTAREKMNLRTPEVMTAVQEQVESHYRSDIVDKVRRAGGILAFGDVTVRLAKQFGFCYGVERAIDLAYAARKVFKAWLNSPPHRDTMLRGSFDDAGIGLRRGGGGRKLSVWVLELGCHGCS